MNPLTFDIWQFLYKEASPFHRLRSKGKTLFDHDVPAQGWYRASSVKTNKVIFMRDGELHDFSDQFPCMVTFANADVGEDLVLESTWFRDGTEYPRSDEPVLTDEELVLIKLES